MLLENREVHLLHLRDRGRTAVYTQAVFLRGTSKSTIRQQTQIIQQKRKETIRAECVTLLAAKYIPHLTLACDMEGKSNL